MNSPSLEKTYRVLIKFMDEEYVDDFMNEGLLFMNNIAYFKKYESSDIALRKDCFEGLEASFRAEGSEFWWNGIQASGLIGIIDISYDSDDFTNIYSMTKISDKYITSAGSKGLYLSDRFCNFGNRAVVITGANIIEFEKRLKTAFYKNNNVTVHEKDNILAKQIKYVCRKEHDNKMGVFCKFDDYSWQYEWRIALKQNTGQSEYSLKIGSLSDIAQVFETESIIREPLKLIRYHGVSQLEIAERK